MINIKVNIKERAVEKVGDLTDGAKEFLGEKLITINGKQHIVDDSYLIPITSKNQGVDVLQFILEEKYGIEVDGPTLKRTLNIVSSYNQITSLNVRRDLLAKEDDIKLDFEMKKLTEVRAGLPKCDAFSFDAHNKGYKDFIEEYLKFNPHINKIADIALYGYIVPQKNDYWAINMVSNGGKGLIQGGLARIGGTLVIKQNHLKSFMDKMSETSSISVEQFNNSLSFSVDEFTYFSEDLKSLDREIKIAEKGRMGQTVVLGAKFLWSANKSTSFSGGVDPQVFNRVRELVISTDSDNDKITDKEWYKAVGGDQAVEYLGFYMRERMQKKLEKLLQMDKIEAHSYVRSEYEKIASKHELDLTKVESLDRAIENEIFDGANALVEHNPNITFVDENTLFIKAPSKTIEAIFNNQLSKSKSRHYMGRLESWTHVREKAGLFKNYMGSPTNLQGKLDKKSRGFLIKRADTDIDIDMDSNTTYEIINGKRVPIIFE